MLKCFAKVDLEDGTAIIQHCRIAVDGVPQPFTKAHIKDWLPREQEGVVSVEVYGPRSAEYKFYMELTEHQEEKEKE